MAEPEKTLKDAITALTGTLPTKEKKDETITVTTQSEKDKQNSNTTQKKGS